MRRIALLVVVSLAAVAAGCSGGPPATDPATTSVTPAPVPTDTDPAAPTPSTTRTTTDPGKVTTTTTREDAYTTVTTTRDRHDRWLRGEVHETNPAEIADRTSKALAEVDPEYRSLYRAAVENGTVTRRMLRGGPDGTGDYPVHANGTYYDISRTTVRERTVQAYQFYLSHPADNDVAADTDPVAFENLSAVDRRIFRKGLPPAEERADLAGFSGPVWYRFENASVEDSRLVDGPTLITYDDETYSVTFEERERVRLSTFRYTATPVANSTAEYRRLAVQRHVTNFSTANLEGTARERMRRAIETGSIDFHSPNPHVPPWVRTLRDWLRGHHFIRYEGELYVHRIYYVME